MRPITSSSRFATAFGPDYKTGEGIEPALFAQFHPLEEALAAMGVVVWPMVELEADDALASAARIASEDQRVEKVCIWTVDKDLAQCVRGDRVVQMDRRANKILDAEGVRQKFGVAPALIPDFLALVGDAADGYPGISGIGRVTAAQLLNRYGAIENFPPAVLGDHRDPALLFKNLATLRTDATLFRDVDELALAGPHARIRLVDASAWKRRACSSAVSSCRRRLAGSGGARRPGLAARSARRSAARASRRVESSVGSGEIESSMISGSSVQPSTTASQPASFIRPITC